MWTRNNWVLAFQIVYQQTIEIKDILDNTLFILIKTEHVQFKEEREIQSEREREREKMGALNILRSVYTVLCTCTFIDTDTQSNDQMSRFKWMDDDKKKKKKEKKSRDTKRAHILAPLKMSHYFLTIFHVFGMHSSAHSK